MISNKERKKNRDMTLFSWKAKASGLKLMAMEFKKMLQN